MRVEFNVPDHARLIEILLEGFIRAGELLIRSGAAPWRPPLEIRLQDDEVPGWKLPPETAETLIADCEDLVIFWAAGLRARGKDPTARARIKTTGPLQTHCLLLTHGKLVDVYEEHLAAQRRRAAADPEFALAGFGSFLHSVGHGISSAAHGVAHAAQAVGRGVVTAGKAVGGAAQYVAKDLPKDILHEAGSGIKNIGSGVADFVHDVGAAGSMGVNAVGDVVAGGAQDAIHQIGKLAGGVGQSFSGGFGDDVRPYNGGAAPAETDTAGDMPAEGGADGIAAGGGGGAPYDGDEDPWAGMGPADGVPDDDAGGFDPDDDRSDDIYEED